MKTYTIKPGDVVSCTLPKGEKCAHALVDFLWPPYVRVRPLNERDKHYYVHISQINRLGSHA